MPSWGTIAIILPPPNFFSLYFVLTCTEFERDLLVHPLYSCNKLTVMQWWTCSCECFNSSCWILIWHGMTTLVTMGVTCRLCQNKVILIHACFGNRDLPLNSQCQVFPESCVSSNQTLGWLNTTVTSPTVCSRLLFFWQEFSCHNWPHLNIKTCPYAKFMTASFGGITLRWALNWRAVLLDPPYGTAFLDCL